MTPRKQHTACITGVADTAMGELPGSTALGLHAEAANAALKDAGLTAQDIDGVLCTYSMTVPHLMLSSVFRRYFGISPASTPPFRPGGRPPVLCWPMRWHWWNPGRAVMLCVTGDNRLTGMTPLTKTVAALATVGHPEFEQPYGMSVPASYALVAQAYLHRYGVSRDRCSLHCGGSSQTCCPASQSDQTRSAQRWRMSPTAALSRRRCGCWIAVDFRWRRSGDRQRSGCGAGHP
ncbi:MAG: hypothetical protein R3D81_13880 [Thalassovita sp.]